MQDDLRLEVLSDPRLLTSVRALVRNYICAFGFSPERVDEVVLAVDEACTNSVRHAFGGRRDRQLEVVFRSDRRWVEIVVRDDGKPAPRERMTRKAFDAPHPRELKPGGLGVQLIFRVFDKVTFATGARRGNCVTMRLRRPGAQGAGRRLAAGGAARGATGTAPGACDERKL